MTELKSWIKAARLSEVDALISNFKTLPHDLLEKSDMVTNLVLEACQI